MQNASQKALLLVNLGTPQAPSLYEVGRFLAHFLNDPRVIDLPAFLRIPLVNGLILPLRVRKSTQAYQSIWTKEGSPLSVHSQNLAMALQKKLQSDVFLAMRYGKPNLLQCLQQMPLERYSEIVILPLFPQYASATTGSIFDALQKALKGRLYLPKMTFINEFYKAPSFIEASALLYKQQAVPADAWIFSFHGLPQRHLQKITPQCIQRCQLALKEPGPCNAENNLHTCYRAQCHATAQGIAQHMGLNPQQYTVSFQSRLGTLPWIPPYTDQLLQQLARSGIQNVAIACPSFVTDCLETLEEIGIRAKAQWQSLGGKNLYCMPSLNADPIWVEKLAEELRQDYSL